MNSNMDMRLVYENAFVAFQEAFGYPDKKTLLAYFKLTQGALRFERPIIAGQTLYTFNTLKNEPETTLTESRMIQQDSHLIYQIGVFLATPTGDSDVAYPLYTYPNQVAFGANAAANQALYNGRMLLTINGDQVLTKWDLYRHYCPNQTQATAAPGAGSPIDQNRGSWDGFYPMEPNVTFIGSKDNVLQIILPQGGISSVQANSRIVILFRTIQAYNSTVVS